MSLYRLGIVLLAILVSASLGTACGGGSGPEQLVLRAQGTTGSAVVSYDTPDGEATEAVSLPWEMAIEVEGDWTVLLVVTNERLEGEVTCAIGGLRLPVGATGEAAATCRASGDGSEVSASSRGEGFVRVNGEPAAVASLRFPVGRPALRAFAAIDDVGYSAAGTALIGSNVVTGEQTRSTVATGVNSIAADGTGAIYAASNSGSGDDPEDIVRVVQGQEAVFFSVPHLGDVVATDELVWMTVHEPDALLVVDAATGEERSRIPGDFELLAAAGDFALVWTGDEAQTLDVDGRVIASEPAANRPAVAAFDGGFLLLGFLDPNTPILRLVDADLETMREGTDEIPILPSEIHTTQDGAIFIGREGIAAGIDAESFATLCTVQTTFRFVGAGAGHLFFHDTAEGDLVAYARADLGC